MNKDEYEKFGSEVLEKFGIYDPIGDDERVIKIQLIEDTEPPAYEFLVGTLTVEPCGFSDQSQHIEFHTVGQGMAADEESLGVALAEALLRFKDPNDEQQIG